MANNFSTKDRILAHLMHWVIPGWGHRHYLRDPSWHLWVIFVIIGLNFLIFPGIFILVVGHLDLAVKMGTIEGKPVFDSLPKNNNRG